ncbi:Hypothetical predicted protein [Pelobates cultripes]|uniref:Uncharacterized protein n=1 Tax=Pelobates cultripes TaxID=61616 RepID=A0AAD1WHT7_PELCU|nr:Hypothetical predicted protein [Pelobates cultripes]
MTSGPVVSAQHESTLQKLNAIFEAFLTRMEERGRAPSTPLIDCEPIKDHVGVPAGSTDLDAVSGEEPVFDYSCLDTYDYTDPHGAPAPTSTGDRQQAQENIPARHPLLSSQDGGSALLEIGSLHEQASAHVMLDVVPAVRVLEAQQFGCWLNRVARGTSLCHI